jgi:hypothetical protein
LYSVLCCQVEVSVSGWSLVQRSPTDCGVSECDREAWIMRRPWPTGGCCAIGNKNCAFETSSYFNTARRSPGTRWLSYQWLVMMFILVQIYQLSAEVSASIFSVK